MESKNPNEQKNDKESDDDFMKTMRELMGLKQKPTIPNLPINKKIQKKLLKDKKQKKLNDSNTDNLSKEDNQQITKKMVYPSGIVKITIKNGKNQIIKEEVDYNDIKQIYINNIKDNLDRELIKLIENSFLLYNRRQIIKNIVKKPYSTKILEEKILLWKYYIKNLTSDEKALLVRKLLYYIGKFSEKVYEEFINIKEISNAYFIFKTKGKLYKEKDKTSAWINAQNFYTMDSIIGYDVDGNVIEDKEKSSCNDEMRAMLLIQHQLLNIKNELNGTGYGFAFLKELKELGDMYTNASYIFESIFHECYNIFDDKNLFIFQKIEIYRILWNFFVDYFIDDSFVMKFLIELKYIFGVYKQDEMIKFMHDLVLYRWNIQNSLDFVKKNLEKLLGPEEIYDEKEKVEKMNNIDDVMKYIEGEGKQKKKKKKKKKKDENNIINEIENDKENIYGDIDTDDTISMISEADSILDSFKNDLIEETEFNTGNKIVPLLSSEFLNQFKK
jgi:hypothetical protein